MGRTSIVLRAITATFPGVAPAQATTPWGPPPLPRGATPPPSAAAPRARPPPGGGGSAPPLKKPPRGLPETALATQFFPETLTVRAGDTVRWPGSGQHTATFLGGTPRP